MDDLVWLDSVEALILPEANLLCISFVTTTKIFSAFSKVVDGQNHGGNLQFPRF